MRKILGLCLVVGLVGYSTQLMAKSKFDPDCKTSGFDNTRVCSVKPYGTYVFNKNSILDFVSFGAIWVDRDPDNVSLVINLNNIATNIKSVSFNIDGKIQTFNADLNANKVSRSGNLFNTRSMVTVPISYLQTIVNSKDVKYRVATLSDGYREGSFFSEDGKEAEPIQAFKEIIKIQENENKAP